MLGCDKDEIPLTPEEELDARHRHEIERIAQIRAEVNLLRLLFGIFFYGIKIMNFIIHMQFQKQNRFVQAIYSFVNFEPHMINSYVYTILWSKIFFLFFFLGFESSEK